MWRDFCILMEPVSYTFVSVNRRKNEAPIQTVTEPVPSKSEKLATNIRGYKLTDNFFTV